MSEPGIYMCPECGGLGKKDKKKCKVCKGKGTVYEDAVRKRGGRMKRALYLSTYGQGYRRLEDKRRSPTRR